MLEPEIREMPVGVLSLFSSVAVSLVGIGDELEWLALINEFIDELHRILHVDVIVHGPVGEDENTFVFVGMGQR